MAPSAAQRAVSSANRWLTATYVCHHDRSNVGATRTSWVERPQRVVGEPLVVLGEVLRGQLDGKQTKAVNHYGIYLLVRATPGQPTQAPSRCRRMGSRAVTSPPGLRFQFLPPSSSVSRSTGSRFATTTEFGELFEIGTHADIGSARVSSSTVVEDRYVTASAVESVNTMSASIFRRDSGRLTGCAATSVQGTPSLRALADRVSMMGKTSDGDELDVRAVEYERVTLTDQVVDAGSEISSGPDVDLAADHE